MRNEDNKILKIKPRIKFIEGPVFISFDNKVLLPKMHSSQNNPKTSYTEEKAKHIPSDYAWY